jgi:subtilisin family serine protease
MKYKVILGTCLLIGNLAAAQQENALSKPNWYNLDLKVDGQFGISMEKAYTELLTAKTPKPVIVAVIDDGLDTAHQDLKNTTWRNLKEISGNGRDDDRNGFIDDVNGWNFLESSSNIYGPVPPAHGTHVTGIITALRHNSVGINGVTNAVKIMPIRCVTDRDLLAKDEAHAIRYAVDNGAKVVNMSFDSCLTQNRELVIQAIQYAISKDILIVQAAGNGHFNDDNSASYRGFRDQKIVDEFIVVGASGFADDSTLAAPFSNYGLKTVDVFAPGFAIVSTIPGNKYEAHYGTSMACPVVAGLAAVIRAYYPELSAKQVKIIMMRSVIKRNVLKDKCISGGVVNAYEALKIAQDFKNKLQ